MDGDVDDVGVEEEGEVVWVSLVFVSALDVTGGVAALVVVVVVLLVLGSYVG